MRKRSKVLLAIALVLLTVGLLISTDIIREPRFAALYVILPLGAIFFGLFLMSRMLDQESKIYDEETAKTRAAADPTGRHY